jgi:uncharacterized protein
MKTFNRVTMALLILLSVGSNIAFALNVPDHPEGRVTDFTATLSPSEISSLNYKLADFEEKTTNQIAVLFIPSLEGDNLEDYSIRLADKWKIGQQGKDNGVILLIVKKDRRLRIEVGYGLEHLLTDSRAGSIIRNTIVPSFKKDRFFEGINRGIDAIIKAISPTFHPKKLKVGSAVQSGFPNWVKWFLIGIGSIFFSIIFFGYMVVPILFNYWDWKSAKSRGITNLGFWRYHSVGEGGGNGRFAGFGGGFSGGGGCFGGGGASGGW